MKILQVTNYFKPSWEAGGVARVAYEISKELSDKGHEVTVFTTNGTIKDSKIILNNPIDVDGISVYYFNSFLNYIPWKTMPFPFFLPFIARKQIQKFDIIHIHEHRTFMAITVYFLARLYKIPFIVQPHGSIPTNFSKSSLKIFFDVLFGNKILFHSKNVIALSEIEKNQFIQFGINQEKIVVIPNGISIDKYTFLPIYGLFRSKYGVSNNIRIILFLGRIQWIKGIDILIDAFKIISPEFENTILIIVGPDDGELHSLIEKTKSYGIENKVIFTGPLYESEKISAYVDADIYVLPSRYETFPLTILEAMACGTPVIVSNNCGIANIIEKNCAGLVFNSTKEGLVNSLQKMLYDDKLKLLLKNNGDFFIKKYFTWKNIIPKYEKVYKFFP